MYNTYQDPYGYNNKLQEEISVLMSPPQLSEYLGIGRNLSYSLLASGTIKGFKIGNQWKVSKVAVDQYIKEQSGLQ